MPRPLVVITALALLLLLAPGASAARPDHQGPTITITAPAATTYQQNASVTASYSCSDRSGVASCNGPVPSGSAINTSQPGSFAFTVNATDNLGNGSTRTVTYTVQGSAPPPSGWTGSCANGYVALTYDDGPSTLTTQYVDRLVANGVRATFFLVGNQQNAFPGGAGYEASHAMYLADHTMSHPHLTTLATSQWQFEISQQQAITAGTFGEYLFRPPYGESNGPIWDYSESRGMRETKWSLDTNDWQNPGAATVASRAGAMRNRDIVLMHDGYQGTLDAMPTIFQTMKNKALCPGRIVPSWDNPIFTSWGEPMYLDVVPY